MHVPIDDPRSPFANVIVMWSISGRATKGVVVIEDGVKHSLVFVDQVHTGDRLVGAAVDDALALDLTYVESNHDPEA